MWYQPSKKLTEKFLSPYKILAQPSSHSVTLWLPDSLRAVHPWFHISMLEPAPLNQIPNQVQPPPPPVLVANKPKFQISEILDSKVNNQHHACNDASYYTLSIGQVTRALMKKPHGCSLPNLGMHPNSLQIFIRPIQPNQALCLLFLDLDPLWSWPSLILTLSDLDPF